MLSISIRNILQNPFIVDVSKGTYFSLHNYAVKKNIILFKNKKRIKQEINFILKPKSHNLLWIFLHH